MRQVSQRPRNGRVGVVEAPDPILRPGWVLVANRCSLISTGTERSKIALGGKSLVGKARARPDLARKVIDRARTDGVRATATLTRERLEALTPLGYSSAGVVLRVGAGVEGLAPGDRVACGGGGFANHADVVAVPRNLVARIPDGVPFESAAYATVGAVALHAVRRAEAAVGESVGVVGLGLVGQLAATILRASGCRPVGVDLDPTAVQLAVENGCLAFVRDVPAIEQWVSAATGGIGLDAVLVCAAGSSTDPLELAAQLVRERGRIVVVGDVPLKVDRGLLYEKELDLRVSRSYGPGRYDRQYEEYGRELPAAYVRWTEQRNMQGFLDLVAAAKVDPTPLTTHRFRVDRAEEAYAVLTGGNGNRPFGILLEYDGEQREPAPAALRRRRRRSGSGRIGLIGAGSFARATLLPALKAAGAELVAVASDGGLSAADVAARFDFDRAVSSEELLGDDEIDGVVIATRHSSHAALTAAALQAGKTVFVEKPLALSVEELAEIESALSGGGPLMVGFNRRFAPLVGRLRDAVAEVPAPVLLARVNAGPLPAEHWAHDVEDGGGRLLGEGCHFVDLLAHLSGARVASAHAVGICHPQRPIEASEDVVATLRFANGAVGTLLYSGGGDPRLPKERVEVFGAGFAAVLDDFRRLELYRGGRQRVVKGDRDKGHYAEMELFVRVLKGEDEAPAIEGYLNSTRATLALVESLRSGSVEEVE